MPTKTTFQHRFIGIKTFGKKYFQELVEDYRAEDPIDVLSYIVKQHVPIFKYKNVEFNYNARIFDGTDKYSTSISIDETRLPNGVLAVDSIKNLPLYYDQTQKYDEDFFRGLVSRHLLYYKPNHLVQKYGGILHLYDGVKENNLKIPALLEIGKVIMGKDIENIRDYAPDLPKTKEVEGVYHRKSIPNKIVRG